MPTSTFLKVIPFLFLSTIFVSCSTQSDRDTAGLNGDVKSCHERAYNAELIAGEWESTELQENGHRNSSYDKDGQYMGSEYLSADGNINASLKPIYENGKLSEENFYDQYGELMTQTKYTQISKKEVSFEAFSPEGVKQIEGSISHKNQRMARQSIISLVKDASGEELVTVIEYDKNGNMLLSEQSNSEGEIIMSQSFEYLAFDDMKNWTKKLNYDNLHKDGDEPQGIVLREINYY